MHMKHFSKFKPFKPMAPSGQRLYAVGDVHGCVTLLDGLLARIEQDNRERQTADVTLILLGDLIDRGPASRDVVSRIRTGVSWARTIALMGNHEALMLDSLDGKRIELESWLRFGGRETLESWGVPRATLDQGTLSDIICAAQAAVSAEERGWLGRMRHNLRIGDYFFVHAGVKPGIPLDRQTADDCLWIRDEFLKSSRKHGAVIVHGHSIRKEVETRFNRIGLDTGAYLTGRLTAVGIEGSDHWFMSTQDDASDTIRKAT